VPRDEEQVTNYVVSSTIFRKECFLLEDVVEVCISFRYISNGHKYTF